MDEYIHIVMADPKRVEQELRRLQSKVNKAQEWWSNSPQSSRNEQLYDILFK